MTAVLRLYQPSDHDAVRALIESVLAEFGFAHTITSVERDLAEIESRYGGDGAGFWVADDGGEVVGTVAVRPKEGRTCELKRLYLRPDRRGTGLGQQLYAHAENFARAHGYDTIWLDSSRRFGRAHRLYERNGFTLVERIDNDWEDNIYGKRLA